MGRRTARLEQPSSPAFRADHEPLRTARTKLLLFLLFAFMLPLLKFTFHALFGLFAYVDADQ